MSIKMLSVIVPVYNEESRIATVLDQITAVELWGGIAREIIVIDDTSTDATPSILSGYVQNHPHENIRVVRHDVNQGKGAAIRTAIALITGEAVIIQDADLEYDPSEYNCLLAPLISGRADVVYGSRFTGGNAHRVLFFHHTMANKLLTFFSNLFSNINLTDMETGYKLFRSDILKQIVIRENRFGFEPEITAKIARIKSVRIYEVGISYYGRTYAEGKKIRLKDGLRALYCIVKYAVFCRN